MKNLNSILILIAAMLLFAGSSCSSVKETKTESIQSIFLILVETTDDGIKLKCAEGCAWKYLSFTLKPFQPQEINQNGMFSPGDQADPPNKNLADFHFSIKKTSDGVRLEGIKGTKWENLSFNCPNNRCHQYIDENGMTSKN